VTTPTVADNQSLASRFAGDNGHKALFFGVTGALGCLFGALLAEPLWALLPRAGGPQVDVLFVLDITGSMQAQIDGVRAGIVDFARKLSERGLDERVGVVAFRDETIGEPTQVLEFGQGPFTANYQRFQAEVGRLRADGGGDSPESSYDGLRVASRQPFRRQATKVLLLITDAPPKLPDGESRSAADVVGELKQHGVDQLHVVIDLADRDDYVPLQKEASGEVFNLGAVASGAGGFDSLLPILGERIAEATVRGLASNSAIDVAYAPRQLAVTALWTGLLATGVGLSLVGGQNHYLRKPTFDARQAFIAASFGLAIGVVAGTMGQVVGFAPQFVSGTDASGLTRLLASALGLAGMFAGWVILGGLVGRGLAAFVPNLAPWAAIAGGIAGGLAGAVGFIALSAVVGDTGGRLLGATVLGFCIGIMIALAEAATRDFFLEVRYGARETIRVTLGAAPVTVGADGRTCTVFVAPATRPVNYKYWIDGDGLKLLDYAQERTERIAQGDERTLGNVTLTVRSGRTGGASAAGAPSRGTAPPPPPPPMGRPAAPAATVVRPAAVMPPATAAVPHPTPMAPPSAAAERRLPPPPPPPPPPSRKV